MPYSPILLWCDSPQFAFFAVTLLTLWARPKASDRPSALGPKDSNQPRVLDPLALRRHGKCPRCVSTVTAFRDRTCTAPADEKATTGVFLTKQRRLVAQMRVLQRLQHTATDNLRESHALTLLKRKGGRDGFAATS